jgi:hypothetical protein
MKAYLKAALKKVSIPMVVGWVASLVMGLAALDPSALPAGTPPWARTVLALIAILVASANHSFLPSKTVVDPIATPTEPTEPNEGATP